MGYFFLSGVRIYLASSRLSPLLSLGGGAEYETDQHRTVIVTGPKARIYRSLVFFLSFFFLSFSHGFLHEMILIGAR